MRKRIIDIIEGTIINLLCLAIAIVITIVLFGIAYLIIS